MTAQTTSALEVLHPGMLSLVQDAGRYGQAHLGLTSSGPADKEAFDWANRLLQNPANSTVIEVTFGGLKLKAKVNTVFCVTGAELQLTVNGEPKALWQSHRVQANDVIELGFATHGVRNYLAVKGGFDIAEQFASCATVIREGIGGLSGDKLKAGDLLPCSDQSMSASLKLASKDIPRYSKELCLRVVLGYQHASFSRLEQRRFFSSEYHVSKQWDRMGYRLTGPAIQSSQQAMLSEGICLGAIQIPSDGQPIVLMQDRQTIGGYPKIGSVFSLDLAKLGQAGQGTSVRFEPITMDCAHNELVLANARMDKVSIDTVPWD